MVLHHQDTHTLAGDYPQGFKRSVRHFISTREKANIFQLYNNIIIYKQIIYTNIIQLRRIISVNRHGVVCLRFPSSLHQCVCARVFQHFVLILSVSSKDKNPSISTRSQCERPIKSSRAESVTVARTNEGLFTWKAVRLIEQPSHKSRVSQKSTKQAHCFSRHLEDYSQ